MSFLAAPVSRRGRVGGGWALGVAVTLSLMAWGVAARAADDVTAQEEAAMQAAAAAAAPGVVRIETIGGLERVGGRLIGDGPTTGLIVSDDGYILSSSFNFVQQPSSILVTLPSGQRAAARIVARDHSRMLVLLKVAVDESLPTPTIAPRSSFQVGQWTLALGRTFPDGSLTISAGILSATNRIWGKAIQTDAKVSPNNYGGPLVDLHGRVLGVLAPMSPQQHGEQAGAEWYDSGIGFAIPLADLAPHLDKLKQGQDLHAGLMGVSMKGTDILADPALLAAVQPRSPADKAGLKAGDTIVEIDGQPIVRQAQLRHAIGGRYAGETIDVTALRGDERIAVRIELVDKLEPYAHPFLGVLPQRGGGPAVVRWVYPDSPAARGGLEVGERIVAVDGEEVAHADALRERLAALEMNQRVVVRAARGDAEREVEVRLGALPSEIPAALPVDQPAPDAPPAGIAVGRVEIKLPEDQHECFAYVPENYRPDGSYALVLWLHAPGRYVPEAIVARWQAAAAERGLIVLAPKSLDDARWQPTELDYLKAVLEDVLGRYAIDRQRIVVAGEQGGGALAYLAALTQREMIRGVAAIDAAPPDRLALPDNDPILRLAIYSAVPEASPLASRVAARLGQLKERKFPVTERKLEAGSATLNAHQLDELVRWIDTLDRL